MRTWLLGLASVIVVSLVSLIGLATTVLDERRLRWLATLLVSFAVGALLGDAFLHLIPESFARAPEPRGASLLVLGGILLFFVVEKLLRHRDAGDTLPPLAAINLLGDGIHNLLDGMLIGASYLVGPTLGISTTLAVIAHEVPQELGDFGVLVHSGLPVRRAIALNLLSASAAIAGTVIVLLARGAVAGGLVPVAAGGFVYIAAADLIPELHRDRSVRALLQQAGLIAAGIAAMAALTLAE
ncbi:MAG TPA: ZIP family metal transporter [Kofleriaceae bacterium]|nr:ZIP family metal transporter [Kofleriaceae bacterium]